MSNTNLQVVNSHTVEHFVNFNLLFFCCFNIWYFCNTTEAQSGKGTAPTTCDFRQITVLQRCELRARAYQLFYHSDTAILEEVTRSITRGVRLI